MVHRILFIILQKTFEKFARFIFYSTYFNLIFSLLFLQAAMTGVYTLPDIGLIFEKLMGHGYRSNYTRRRFRTRYATTFTQPNRLRQVRFD
jgi:hypothetical protein